jgi:hypothetical protein
MLDEYGFELYEENEFPLAYLLTFRTFGTWLHGDIRWSVGRSRRSARESKLIQPNVPLNEAMAVNQPPVILNKNQRETVEEAIIEVCKNRGYFLRAVNARTNHVHAAVTAGLFHAKASRRKAIHPKRESMVSRKEPQISVEAPPCSRRCRLCLVQSGLGAL